MVCVVSCSLSPPPSRSQGAAADLRAGRMPHLTLPGMSNSGARAGGHRAAAQELAKVDIVRKWVQQSDLG